MSGTTWYVKGRCYEFQSYLKMVYEILNVNSKHVFSFKHKIYITQKILNQSYKNEYKEQYKVLLKAT